MNIDKILSVGETQEIEFKQSMSLLKEGCKALCGMLNTDQGSGAVFFGINDSNEVVGIDGNIDSTQKKISLHISTKFDPKLKHSIQLLSKNNLTVLVLFAKRAEDVSFYEYDGRGYIKEGSTKRTLTILEKNNLEKCRNRNNHNGPWKCDKCATFIGMLGSIALTDKGPKKNYKCNCGGEYWPIN